MLNIISNDIDSYFTAEYYEECCTDASTNEGTPKHILDAFNPLRYQEFPSSLNNNTLPINSLSEDSIKKIYDSRKRIIQTMMSGMFPF